MRTASVGQMVTISYIGTLDNGRIFESTEDGAPLTFILGNNQILPALEAAIIGMKVGEARNIQIPAADWRLILSRCVGICFRQAGSYGSEKSCRCSSRGGSSGS